MDNTHKKKKRKKEEAPTEKIKRSPGERHTQTLGSLIEKSQQYIHLLSSDQEKYL